MSEGSDGKTQLGRILLQRKQVVAGELDELGQLANELSQAVQSATARAPRDLPVELTTALFDQNDAQVIDLRRISLRLSVLSFVSREAARDKLLLPLYADSEQLFVAVADLGERALIEELEFTSGRHVHAYLATHGSLRDVIESAYAAEAAGQASYRGLLTGSLDAAPNERAHYNVEVKPATAKLPELAHLDAGDSVLPPAGVPGGQALRLLVVDDSDDIRRLLVRVFRERDYEVFESATGTDALQKVRECKPDLMLLDAMLPDVHGFDVCRRIKGSRRYGNIPIVMMSAVYRGWRFAEDLRRSYGVEAFMEKPFRIGEVVAAVERALSGGASPSQLPEAEVSGPAGEQLKAGIDAYARGEVEQAIDHLKRGISIDPLAFRLHYHLGLLYGKQENVFEAITELETAADLKPRDFSTLKNLAVLYQRAGFRLKASELWERALGSAPDDATRSSIRNHLVSLL